MPPSKQARSDSSRKAGPPRIAVGPDEPTSWMRDAIVAGGGQVVATSDAEALVWTVPRQVDRLEATLEANQAIAWVQLPFAGIEPFVDLINDERTWTCGKGIYAEPVAELALGLAIAGLRGFGDYARATTWLGEAGRNLHGASVSVLGGGGITEALLRMLAPFDCHVTVVRNRIIEMEGADNVVAAERYVDALAGADVVVLALPLTPDTEGIISRTELEMMESNAWLINVARGKHVVTDDLVWALQNDVIGGTGLDVTDPEPLPDGHPLWTLSNCIITPHVGATLEMGDPLLAERITANVRLFAHDKALTGAVHPDLGY